VRLFCADQQVRFLALSRTLRKTQQAEYTSNDPVAPLPFARYTSRLRYGSIFFDPYFLVVQLPPPNRRWEWRKNEPGPSRSQGWHDAYLYG
jgi:hypothetical protein